MENLSTNTLIDQEKLSFDKFREEVLKDYRTACDSREASLLGRKEVLTGKAKFGIFGDGKEVPQVAMAKFFRPGDFYAGYYRDQTFAFATGAVQAQEKVKIGFITDMSSLYADVEGKNGATAIQMAIDDFGGKVNGLPIEVAGNVKSAVDHAVNEQVGALQTQVRNDEAIEKIARRARVEPHTRAELVEVFRAVRQLGEDPDLDGAQERLGGPERQASLQNLFWSRIRGHHASICRAALH